jgi:hypothetical protein
MLPPNTSQTAVRLKEIEHRLTEERRLLESFSGVQIADIDKELHLTLFSSTSSKFYELSIRLHSSGALTEVRLQPDDVPHEDIVNHAIQTNNLQFLVRELKARIQNK